MPEPTLNLYQYAIARAYKQLLEAGEAEKAIAFARLVRENGFLWRMTEGKPEGGQA